mmetsp:Transcript_24165/g.61176  ORF Transcript_24165/g.61176 Transcript_24165/m.61176 type:complete len:213 (-) Transcript_24165:914-1552(-)
MAFGVRGGRHRHRKVQHRAQRDPPHQHPCPQRDEAPQAAPRRHYARQGPHHRAPHLVDLPLPRDPQREAVVHAPLHRIVGIRPVPEHKLPQEASRPAGPPHPDPLRGVLHEAVDGKHHGVVVLGPRALRHVDKESVHLHRLRQRQGHRRPADHGHRRPVVLRNTNGQCRTEPGDPRLRGGPPPPRLDRREPERVVLLPPVVDGNAGAPHGDG